MRTILVLLLPVVLGACGYKGALYLPDACKKNCECKSNCTPPATPTPTLP